jgi:phage terminase large subunit GpA-like protein
MLNIKNIGQDWLLEEVSMLTENIEYIGPVDFAESVRIIPSSLTSKPGPMRYDVNPYMREPLECFSMQSPVREVNFMKGVQLTYTVGLVESVLLYFMAYLKIYGTSMISADKGLVDQRIDNNIIPMINLAGFGDLIQSSDETPNKSVKTKKTGKTKDLIQWEGGGFLLPLGAVNQSKMRSNSVLLMLKDELTDWKDGDDGCSDVLTDSRCVAFWENRKILRGSTPGIKGICKISKQYVRGDQRKYFVKCKHCGFEQFLEWRGEREDKKKYGITFETVNNVLVEGSVKYLCKQCLGEHYNHDKTDLFDPANGAHWIPTAESKSRFIRSYHLSSLYSPVGFMSWDECVNLFLESYDNEKQQIIDIKKYQTHVNNTLGIPFEQYRGTITRQHVSMHRRTDIYKMGEIPNKFAARWSGSEILFVTCTVDVQKDYLSVKVTGVCRDSITYMIEYFEIEDSDCTDIKSPCWAKLAELIEEKVYTSDNGRKYRIFITLVDASKWTDTVKEFCSDYNNQYSMVFPIFGRTNIKNDFQPTKDTNGQLAYTVNVDIYKHKLAPILRREWREDFGQTQSKSHFNVPSDTTDKQLLELTAENLKKERDSKGFEKWVWHRKSGANNELFDLTVYTHAAIDIVAYLTCIVHYELEKVDWPTFWNFLEERLDEECPLPDTPEKKDTVH